MWISTCNRAINLDHYIEIEVDVNAKTVLFKTGPGAGANLSMSGLEAIRVFDSLRKAGLFANTSFPPQA